MGDAQAVPALDLLGVHLQPGGGRLAQRRGVEGLGVAVAAHVVLVGVEHGGLGVDVQAEDVGVAVQRQDLPLQQSGAHSSTPPDFSSATSEKCGLQLVLVHRQRRADGHVHVEVLVGAEPAAEEHHRLLAGQVAVLQQLLAVLGGVDRVVGLVALLGEARVLVHDHGLAGQVGLHPLGVEVLELDDPGEGDFLVVVVHDAGALEVVDVLDRGLEVDGAPGQAALAVAEVLVDRTGVDDRDLALELVGDVEEVGLEPDLDVGVVGHLRQPRGVAVGGQALVGVAEPAVLEGVAHRQPRDDVRAELGRVGLPLLGGVALDERLVERAADQADRLLLEVGGVLGVDLAGLRGDQLAGLLRGVALAEELVDQPEVHRQRVDLPLVLAEDAVLVAGEGGEPVGVLPHLLVGGVEQVGAVLVHLDAGLRLPLAVGVAAEVVATVEDQHLQAELARAALGDRQPEEA